MQTMNQRMMITVAQDLTQEKIETVDRDQTVSRRSKPSSRTTLIGEQPNPWQPLLRQDAMSRHRGAKQVSQ